jgi:mono/diheme cytochrome c family protein
MGSSASGPKPPNAVMKLLGLPALPFWLRGILIVATLASLLPFAVIARARFDTSDQPRIHIVQDMAHQPKYKAQVASPVFADGRANRQSVTGTVAVGMLDNDDHYFRGYSRTLKADGTSSVTFFDGFPEQVKVDRTLLERGQDRFNIYCSACHGQNGAGQGLVHLRAVAKQEPKWVQPSNLLEGNVPTRPNGHIFNTISNGIRNMGGYQSQISVADRWAIVAYVRALELSQNAPKSVLTDEQLRQLAAGSAPSASIDSTK